MHDDPAARLHALLTTYKADTSAGHIRGAWAQVFDISENDVTALLGAIAGIVTLPEQIRAGMAQLPDVNHDLLLKTLPSIEEALRWCANLDAATGEIKDRISDSALYGLELCSDALQRLGRVDLPADDELASLLGQVDTLVDLILTSSLPPQVQAVLLGGARHLRTSIEQVKVFGVAGVTDAVTHCVGAGVITHTQFPEQTRSDADRRLIEGFWALVGRAATLTTLATGATMLGTDVLKMLH